MPAAIITFIVLATFYLWFGWPTKPINEPNSFLANRSVNAPAKVLGSKPVTIKAVSAVAFETDNKARIFNQNGDETRSIASLTKLMTALVFLDTKPDWNKEIIIKETDVQSGSKANIFVNDKLTTKDVFTIGLVGSDNTAITALVRSTGLSEQAFVDLMNQKAKAIRLGNMKFSDPTGLDINNQGTAVEVTKLAEAAFSRKVIAEALKLPSYSFSVSPKVSRKVISTNQLIGSTLPGGAKMLIGKTGYLNEAGYCFVGIFEYQEKNIVTAVLGVPTDENRFVETIKLLDWTLESYLWDNK